MLENKIKLNILSLGMLENKIKLNILSLFHFNEDYEEIFD